MDTLPIYNLKLKHLLEKFLDPHFQLKNDSNLNSLLSHLSGKDNADLGESLLNLPVLSEWVQQAVNYWEVTNENVSQVVVSFTINLVALLVKAERRFYTLHPNNYLMRVISILKVRTPYTSPSVKLAYIKLLANLTSHKPGMDWLMASQYWEDGLNFCFSTETVYVQREAYSFMYSLFKRGVELAEQFCSTVAARLMSQLNRVLLCYSSTNTSVEFTGQLLSTTKLISFILESYLLEELFTARKYRLPQMFLRELQTQENIYNFLVISQDLNLLGEMSKLVSVISYITIAMENESNIIPLPEISKLYLKMLKLANILLSKNSVELLLKLCQSGHCYLKVLNSRFPPLEDMENNRSSLSYLYALVQTVPIYSISFCCCHLSPLLMEEDDIKDMFFHRTISVMCEDTLRFLYKIKNAYDRSDDFVFSSSYKNLMSVERCFKYLSKSESVLYFQVLCYVFKDVGDSIRENPSLLHKFLAQERLLCFLMQIISKFVTEFDLSWKDAVETICIIDACLDYLNMPDWTSKVTLECLKMLNIIISKQMTPSMALLSDSVSETSVAQVPAILYANLHNPDWEIRDSALEVLHTLAVIAQAKFPSFQSIIVESGLPQLLVASCTEDGESYVRASSLKCLQELIKIPQLWSEILFKENLPGKIIHIFENETEAIVRCEAATLMCDIYQYQSIENSMLHQVCSAMFYAATLDFHWEVKVKSLDFWDIVISKQLMNQGMIDGSFPSVTFSKENRKIVTLNEKEIQSRLNKTLHKLSECGCLAVLLTAMQDYDFSVGKKAVEVTKNLANVLSNYNITAASNMCEAPSSPPSDYMNNNYVANMDVPACSSKTMEADSVIDEIVNSKDVNLLADICVDSAEMKCVNIDKTKIQVVSPCDFLRFLDKDLDLLISERQQWLNNLADLGSLLDDMLKNYDEFSDVNTMDCY